MTIWEKVIVNLEKSSKRIALSAAFFSERARAEIALARLRIKVNDVRSLIDEQYRIIGRTITELKKKGALPDTSYRLMQEEEIKSALEEIKDREKDLEDLKNEVSEAQAIVRPGDDPA